MHSTTSHMGRTGKLHNTDKYTNRGLHITQTYSATNMNVTAQIRHTHTRTHTPPGNRQGFPLSLHLQTVCMGPLQNLQ